MLEDYAVRNGFSNLRFYIDDGFTGKANDEQLENFIKKADRYTDIQNLTAEILTAFIKKILVHERPAPHNTIGV